MNDTTRRFLSGILERVEESRIVELRLFPPLRQGGIESAVAVIAAEPRELPNPEADVQDPELRTPDSESLLASSESHELQQSVQSPISNLQSPISNPQSPISNLQSPISNPQSPISDLQSPISNPQSSIDAEHIAELHVTFDGPRSDERGRRPPHAMLEREIFVEAAPADAPADEPDESIALTDILALPSPEPRESARDNSGRLEILSACYRLVFKGPDRGKWEIEVVHEADAPLETVERVVQGVARRAADTTEAEFYTGESLREALDQPVWIDN